MTSSQHVYELRPRRDKRGFDLISWTPSQLRFWRTSKSGRLKRTATLVLGNFLELLNLYCCFLSY
jgi:hypothetical protein